MSEETRPLLTPKFLNYEMAHIAANAVYETILRPPHLSSAIRTKPLLLPVPYQQCHIVVLVPGMVDHIAEDYPNWPNYAVQPVLLYEESFLDGKGDLEGPFDEIARCKALQLWTDRNDDRTDCIPHMLFKGDTPYWGGVKRRGIVVTCSGVQPYIDKLIAGMIADMLVAMAHAAWKASDDYTNGVDFLT